MTLRTNNTWPIFEILHNNHLSLKNITLYGGNKQNGSALINSDNLTLDKVIIYQNQNNTTQNSTLLNDNNGKVTILNDT